MQLNPRQLVQLRKWRPRLLLVTGIAVVEMALYSMLGPSGTGRGSEPVVHSEWDALLTENARLDAALSGLCRRQCLLNGSIAEDTTQRLFGASVAGLATAPLQRGRRGLVPATRQSPLDARSEHLVDAVTWGALHPLVVTAAAGGRRFSFIDSSGVEGHPVASAVAESFGRTATVVATGQQKAGAPPPATPHALYLSRRNPTLKLRGRRPGGGALTLADWSQPIPPVLLCSADADHQVAASQLPAGPHQTLLLGPRIMRRPQVVRSLYLSPELFALHWAGWWPAAERVDGQLAADPHGPSEGAGQGLA
jgi:hypothetical protein